MMDKYVLSALKDSGYEGESDAAQTHFDGLDDAAKGSVNSLAGENRMTDKILNRLVGEGDKEGALQVLMTGTMEKHTQAIDDRINKLVHNRLDNAGVKPNPGSEASKKVEKNGKETPVPDGFVPLSQVDELREEINQRDIRQEISNALSGESILSGALDIALRELESSAKKNDQGEVVIEMKDGDGVLRAMSPKDAVGALRTTKKFLFKASVSGGSGGGGSDDRGDKGDGKPDLPKVNSYDDLLSDPALLHRYITESPEELKKLEDGHSTDGNAELSRIMSGQGIDARSQVQAALAKMKKDLAVQT